MQREYLKCNIGGTNNNQLPNILYEFAQLRLFHTRFLFFEKISSAGRREQLLWICDISFGYQRHPEK